MIDVANKKIVAYASRLLLKLSFDHKGTAVRSNSSEHKEDSLHLHVTLVNIDRPEWFCT